MAITGYFGLCYYLGTRTSLDTSFWSLSFGQMEGLAMPQCNYTAGVVTRRAANEHKSVMEELKRITDHREITMEDDALWHPLDKDRGQKFEIRTEDECILSSH